MTSTFENEHSMIRLERVVTCACGWVGPLDKFEAHQMEKFTDEFTQLIRDAMKGANSYE